MNARYNEFEIFELIVIEEISEVSQALVKLARFGGDSVYNNQTALDRLIGELHDFIASIEMIGIDLPNFSYLKPSENMKDEKRYICEALECCNNLQYHLTFKDIQPDENINGLYLNEYITSSILETIDKLFLIVSSLYKLYTGEFLILNRNKIISKKDKVKKYNKLSVEYGRLDNSGILE